MFEKEGPIFGADVGKVGTSGVTESNRVAKAKEMLRRAMNYAVNTVGMEFNWAFDIDTSYGNPPNIIATLPESARFKVGENWLPRPDTPEGYAYYKTIVKTTMTDYPAITKITLWSRNSRSTNFGGVSTGMLPEELPAEWKAVYETAPEEAKTPFGPAHVFHAKAAEAVRRALDECSHKAGLRKLVARTDRRRHGQWQFQRFKLFHAS